jgi:hypothetical protein
MWPELAPEAAKRRKVTMEIAAAADRISAAARMAGVRGAPRTTNLVDADADLQASADAFFDGAERRVFEAGLRRWEGAHLLAISRAAARQKLPTNEDPVGRRP